MTKKLFRVLCIPVWASVIWLYSSVSGLQVAAQDYNFRSTLVLDWSPADPVVLDVAWSPDGDMIATVDDSGTLNITLSDQTTLVFQFTRPGCISS